MATTASPNESPVAVQPLHNPSRSAQIVVPKAPIGNQAPGLGAKALLSKKMGKNPNPMFVSPTDNMMTPCSQKLNATKKKHFNKSKPVTLFSPQQETEEASEDDDEPPKKDSSPVQNMDVDDENPF
ncbi:hypothetical protein CPB83DRAFT_803201 [Crepidotus variabilis]|uniref:Uncharacterized protein n=1 Tax=Crepidotus variabilis TaxID=179855 RepID=A0A9P6JVV8_9AGAR|nr:hypothetical protein CPB83DRAFT_803201 [Crepidotus variabilis]